MKAFVLAAGFGSRLKPLSDHIPKPLIPVLNIPCLFYTFFLLKQAGITEIICNIHYHADAIRRCIDSSNLAGLNITFSEEPIILGTGGGLKKCEHLLDGNDFLLVNSDIITNIDFRALIEHHKQSRLSGTLTLYETPEAETIGAIGVEEGLIKDFRNQRNSALRSSFIYTGTAVLGPEIFRFLKNEFSGIVDTGFIGLVDNGGLGYYHHKGVWMDIGTLENYWKANLDQNSLIATMAGAMEREIGMHPHPLSPEAEISLEAEICRSVIGRGCRVGAGSIIRDSVLLSGVTIQPGSRIINSIVTPFSTTIMEAAQ